MCEKEETTMKNTVTRAWKVYGNPGHRQRESFGPSIAFKMYEGNCFVEVENSDKTGTNEYSIVRITGDSAEECEHRLDGQISDGIFENSRVGHVEEIF